MCPQHPGFQVSPGALGKDLLTVRRWWRPSVVQRESLLWLYPMNTGGPALSGPRNSSYSRYSNCYGLEHGEADASIIAEGWRR